MDGGVPELHNMLDFAEQHGVELFLEGVLVYECGEIVFIRSLYGLIDSIDPLHGQFESLAAADGAHGRSRRKDLFRFHGRGGEHGELFAVFEKIEVGCHDQRTSFQNGCRKQMTEYEIK